MRPFQCLWKARIEQLASRRLWIRLLAVFTASLALAYVCFVFTAEVNHDEVEHAHVAFKILNGEIPYRDFYQNHLPSYWLLQMPLVRAFPFSTNVILAARGLNLLALAGCGLFGLRLLRSVRGGSTCFGLSIYAWALIMLALEMDFHVARPDPIMTLLCTAGLCLIPMYGGIANARALLLGILFGLSVSLSPKVIPMVFVVPALISLHCIRDRRLRPAIAVVPYGAGVLLALLPTAWWIFHRDLFTAFRFDVFDLNQALSKPWYLSLGILHIPICIAAILGMLVQVGTCRYRGKRFGNGPLVTALALAAGFALAFLARHAGRYNLQSLMIPIAVGFAGFAIYVCLRIRGRLCQLLFCAALLGYPTVHHTIVALIYQQSESGLIPLGELQEFMNLAQPGGRTCTAFAPFHPVFCRDISELSLGWDLFFAERITDPRQSLRFQNLWHEGIRKTIDQRPDIILRKSAEDYWERALKAGLVSQGELDALDSLRENYGIRRIGLSEVWIRR